MTIKDEKHVLHGAKYFSSLDAASRFAHAPATFQTVMNNLFNPPHFSRGGKRHEGPILSEFVLIFVDDILVFSKTAEEHTKHLEIVFGLLRKEQLQIKSSECVWA